MLSQFTACQRVFAQFGLFAVTREHRLDIYSRVYLADTFADFYRVIEVLIMLLTSTFIQETLSFI